MDMRDRTAGVMIVVGIVGLFAGLWLAISLGWAFVICSMILVVLGIALAVAEPDTSEVADTEEPAEAEPPAKTTVRMRSNMAVLPRQRKEA
jgi:uncharacterized membrane protein